MKIPLRVCACVLAMWLTGVRAESPLPSCPAGTEARVQPIEGNSASQNVCVDPASGMREGPAVVLHANGKVNLEFNYLHDRMHGKSRMFDPEGVLMIESEFDQGEQKASRLTSAGLRTMLGNLQTRASMYSMVTKVSIPKEWTLRYDVMSTAEAMPAEQQAIQAKEDREMACEIFTSPFNNEFQVQLRHVTGEAKVLRETTLAREDCAREP